MSAMKAAERLLNKVAASMFSMGAPARRVPHRVFQDLGARVRAALDEAEVCLHPEVISRPNVLEVFFDLDTWGRLVAPREADVHRALEAEVEAHRARSGYGPGETIALRLFVADPEQIRVPPNRPEVVARRVADPLSIEGAWRSALRHTTVVSGSARPRRRDTVVDRVQPQPESTPPTPLAVLRFEEGERKREAELIGAGVFGRGNGCEVQLDPRAQGAGSAVSRRALAFAPAPLTGVLEVENLGRVSLGVSGSGALLAPGEKLSVQRSEILTWPEEDGALGFALEVAAPSRGEVVVKDGTSEQRVVLRAPRTRVAADPAVFGPIDLVFNVDFVDGTRFLVMNNEGSVPLRLGALEGKQLQWPIDAPRELTAGPLSIAVALEEAP